MSRYGKGASCPSKIEQQDIYIFGINFPRYDINWKSIDAPETSRKKKEKKRGKEEKISVEMDLEEEEECVGVRNRILVIIDRYGSSTPRLSS